MLTTCFYEWVNRKKWHQKQKKKHEVENRRAISCRGNPDT